MVDSIGPTGQAQNVSQTNREQRQTDQRQEIDGTRRGRSISDDVSISEEAISLSQAEEAAQAVSAQLAENPDVALSDNEDDLNDLA
ncbi:MAG: hypothetical protein GC137_05270 [Alphaproteobacteria bacterium]|nr:hypothetical protein [Alphaproteobacteria bacterium]